MEKKNHTDFLADPTLSLAVTVLFLFSRPLFFLPYPTRHPHPQGLL